VTVKVSHLMAVRKGEDVMSTMTGHLRRTILIGVLGTLAVAGAVRLARADVASDKPGAILVFPKIVIDTSGVLGPPTDTEIQITNTSNSVISARCYLIDATSHCSNAKVCSNARTEQCTMDSDCSSGSCFPAACTLAKVADGAVVGKGGCPAGGTCVGPCNPRLVETDFRMTLTKRQPVTWKASEGLSSFPCDPLTNPENNGCPNGLSNIGSDGSPSSAAAAQEDPFVGEIKCVEVDPSTFQPSTGLNPINNFTGDLKGEATIVSADGTKVDARKYNAIGIQSLGPNSNNNDDTLLVGGPAPEYNGCPKALIVDSLFDNAPVTTHDGDVSGSVVTDLTFVPCTEDLATQSPSAATLQFTVYNEFEQRFSTSIGFSCFKEVQLSDIDSRPGNVKNNNSASIFNYAVEGTLSGQIKVRPVAGALTDNRVLAISEEFWECSGGPDGQCTAATNVHLVQGAGNGDQVCLEGATTPPCMIMH
jgi:hypothetical protein